MMRRAAVTIVTMLVALVVAAVGAVPVRAHTGFESSTPADGDTIDLPVDTITITFTGAATPVGDEFVALAPDGVLQKPSSVDVIDDRVFTLRFDPPLAGGQIGVRWSVQASDAHRIDGAFAFTVTAPAPTTAPPTTPPPTTQPPTTQPPTTTTDNATTDTAIAPSTTVADPPSDDATSDPPPGTTEPPPVTATPTDPDVEETAAVDAGAPVPPSPPGTDGTGEVSATETTTLEEFLAVDDARPGESTALIGRIVGYSGVILGLGALAFAGAALRGRRAEVRALLGAVRVLGLVIAVGAAIEYVGVARIGTETLASGWSTSAGFATVLRLVGGLALAFGLADTVSNDGATGSRPAASLSAAVVDDTSLGGHSDQVVRWVPGAGSWIAFVGVAVVVGSFWFDGHTVSEGFRPLHAAVNSVHVVAAAVWVGGVAATAAVVWARHRAGRAANTAELVVRFSTIATIALGAVVLAGGVMAVLVLDSFGDLTATEWGQTLLFKNAAVGVAMLGGAYNHFRLRPALEAAPDSPTVLATLRRTLIAEAVVLVFVVAITARLVAAAT